MLASHGTEICNIDQLFDVGKGLFIYVHIT